MAYRFSGGVQAVILTVFLSLVSGMALAEGPPMITGFSGSKIKLYKDSKSKDVWKKFSAKELRALGGDHKIIAATNSRYAFELENQTVWIKRKNAKTNGVATGLPPCPKVETVASRNENSAGNAVSRGAGTSCP